MRSYVALQTYLGLFVAKSQITCALARATVFLCGGYSPKDLPETINKFNRDWHELYGPKAEFTKYDSIEILTNMLEDWLGKNSDIYNWQFDINSPVMSYSKLVAIQASMYVWDETIEVCEQYRRMQDLVAASSKAKQVQAESKKEPIDRVFEFELTWPGVILWTVAITLGIYIINHVA